jgi:hypothetical protein
MRAVTSAHDLAHSRRDVETAGRLPARAGILANSWRHKRGKKGIHRAVNCRDNRSD